MPFLGRVKGGCIYFKVFFIWREHERDLSISMTQINVSFAVICNPALTPVPFRGFFFLRSLMNSVISDTILQNFKEVK